MAHDPHGLRLPIKIDATSNGEFAPIALDGVQCAGNRLALAWADRHAKRLHMSRRQFLTSSCGAASTLLAFNAANAAAGRDGGFFDVPRAAASDSWLAQRTLEGNEFIVDVQGHFVNPDGAWLQADPSSAPWLASMPKAGCGLAEGPNARSYLQCLGRDEFIKDVFLDSDTDMMVLSFVPSKRELEPLTIEEAAATRDLVARLDGDHRLLLHGRVNPNQDGDLQAMDELAERWHVSAWKTYTQWGPTGDGFFLTDKVGIAFIEKARRLGIRNICVHKGIPFGPQSYQHSLCDDIGPVAKRFADVNFLIYHSGFVPGKAEGPYDSNNNEGIDSLIRSVQAAGLGHNSNVYAELGSTWRYLMRDPDSAAHALGKLLRYLGPRNILWGTDSIWYGSPQDQIQALRSFQISESLRERHGYPQLDANIRAAIFGQNAARLYNLAPNGIDGKLRNDRIAADRQNYRNNPDPHFRTHGPRTRRQFLNLQRWL